MNVAARKPYYSNTWSKDCLTRLKEYWAEGTTCRIITEQLNAEFGTSFTRNAIIGCVSRHGLDKRRQPTRGVNAPAPAPRSVKTKRIPVINLMRKREPRVSKPPRLRLLISPISDLEIPVQQRKQFFDLDHTNCRWPVGNVGEKGFFFCGGVVTADRPYCADHCARAYRMRDEPAN